MLAADYYIPFQIFSSLAPLLLYSLQTPWVSIWNSNMNLLSNFYYILVVESDASHCEASNHIQYSIYKLQLRALLTNKYNGLRRFISEEISMLTFDLDVFNFYIQEWFLLKVLSHIHTARKNESSLLQLSLVERFQIMEG